MRRHKTCAPHGWQAWGQLLVPGSHRGAWEGASLLRARLGDVARLTGGPWGPGGPEVSEEQVQADREAGQASPSFWEKGDPWVKGPSPGSCLTLGLRELSHPCLGGVGAGSWGRAQAAHHEPQSRSPSLPARQDPSLAKPSVGARGSPRNRVWPHGLGCEHPSAGSFPVSSSQLCPQGLPDTPKRLPPSGSPPGCPPAP